MTNRRAEVLGAFVAFALVSSVASGTALAVPKPVPVSMLQGTRLVSEKYNFAAEAPRFDWVWKMEEEARGAASFICEAQGDPLGSIYIYAAKLPPGESVDQRTIEPELKKGLTNAGLQVLGMSVNEVRAGVSYNFVASITAHGQTVNAIGIVAVGGDLFYIVFHFRQETVASDAFTNFTKTFTLLKDPGLPGEGDADGDDIEQSAAYKLAKIISMLMTVGAIVGIGAIVYFLTKRLTKR